MVETKFDVLNIEYEDENYDYPDAMQITVDVPNDFKDKHYSFTEDLIRNEIEKITGSPYKVVDFTAFYSNTPYTLRGNYDAETFEAREKKIGSITIKKNPNFPSGTSLQAYIKTNRAELRKVFGNPNMGESGDGKSKGKEWNLVVGGKRVTIYDKREMGKKGTKYFNIGGDGKYGALLVAQALSIHRNERVHAKEIVPQWIEDRRQYQQVKSIDEHPDLTYERAKEYEDNRRRYRAETFEARDGELKTLYAYVEFLEEKFGNHYEEFVELGLDPYRTNEAETFDVEFNEWAEQEMMSHGKDISFKDWAEDEGMKHGNVPITEWAEHEEESHDARYGAEEGDDCPSCANACKHDDTNMIKVESIYDYEVQSPSNMVIQVTCLDCGESGTFYADEVDWHGEEAKLRYSPQIAVNMMNPVYGDLKCSRCHERFQMAAENWGGDPKGKLATALRKARENAKKPKKPLKIEKLDAETSGQWEIGEQLEEAQMNAEGKKRSGQLSDPFDELSLDSGGWKSIAIGFGVATLTLFGLTK